MNQSRRDVLKSGAGLASAGLLSGLAGCGSLPGGGGGGLVGGGAYYRDWLIAPDEIDEEDHYYFSAIKPSEMNGNDEFSNEDVYETFENAVEGSSSFGPTGIDFESVDELTGLANSTVQIATGSFTVEDIADELDDGDYEEETELDSGERVFLNGSAGTAYGVTGSRIIAAFGGPTSTAGGPEGPDQPSSGAGQENAGSISYGETITSTISDDDPDNYDYGTYEEVTFSGSAGEVITAQTATADNYDEVYLYLEDPDGNLVTDEYAYDEDITDFTLQSSGEYTIIAGTYDAYYSSDVTYTLQLDLVYSPDQLVDTVETVAGLDGGDTPTYTDESDAASDLVDELGGGVFVSGETFEQVEGDNPEGGTLEDSVAEGYSLSFGDGEFDITGVVVYDSEGDVDEGDVEDWADEGTSIGNGNIDDISVSTSGRVATFSGVVDYDDLS